MLYDEGPRDPPAEASIHHEDSSPYPELDSFWSPGEREWGWHVPSMELVPDIGKLIELASIHTPESGPLGPPAAD